jgi:electron transfer flavoprotein alpha subunit
MTTILAIAETRSGELRKVALEAVTAARQLADSDGGGEVHAIVFGAPGIASKIDALGKHGADVVIVVEHAALGASNPEVVAATVAERAKSGGYRFVVGSASQTGRDIAPRVAAKLGAAMSSDVISLQADGDALLVRHPGYWGKVIATYRMTGSPAVVTLRPGAITPQESAKAGKIETSAPALDPAQAVPISRTLRSSSAVVADSRDPSTSSSSKISPTPSGTPPSVQRVQ